MTLKALSHVVLASTVALGVAGQLPVAAFSVSVDQLPTLTLPKSP